MANSQYDHRLEFVGAMTPLAKAVETLTGIPAILTITQAAHESNYGRSGLTQKAFNLFGVTGDSWKKQGLPVIELQTTEYMNGVEIVVKRPFRSYSGYGESLLDWARLVTFSYRKAVEAARKMDANGFFEELQKGGYATDPKYAEKLVSVLDDVKLLAKGLL